MLEWAIPTLIRNLELSEGREERPSRTHLDLHRIREFWVYELKKAALSADLTQELPEDVVERFKSHLDGVLRSVDFMICEDSLGAAAEKLQDCHGQFSQCSISAFFPYVKLGMLTEIHQSPLADKEKSCMLAASMELDTCLTAFGFEPLNRLSSFNKYLETVFTPPRSAGTSQPQLETDEADGLGLDVSVASFVEATLRALHYDLSHCRDPGEHGFLLQLSGFGAAEGPNRCPLLLPFLISNCRPPRLWQEARVQQPPQGRRKTRLPSSGPAFKQLCNLITTAKSRGEGLRLELHTGPAGSKIFDISAKEELAIFSHRAADLSLENALNLGLFQPVSPCQPSGLETRFSVWEKRRLTLTMARSFVHLYPSRWARQGWSAEQVFFLSPLGTMNGSLGPDPVPFIPCVAPTETEDELADSAGGSATMVTDILLLGKILLEVECGRAIFPEAAADNSGVSLLLALEAAVEELEKHTDDHYLAAAEGCIELHRELLGMTSDNRIEHGQKLIYDRVVCPLERSLSLYRRPSPKRRLSKSPEPGSAKRASRRVIKPHRSPKTRSIERHTSADGLPSPSEEQTRTARPTVSEAPAVPQITLFDGLGPATEDREKMKATRDFFNKYYRNFRDRYLEPLPEEIPLQGPSSRQPGSIKICVIDTGVRKDHPVVWGAEIEGRIKECHSWLDGNDANNVEDTFGHGTHVAELLTRVAPRADLCIAKIADSASIPADQMFLIAQAILKATDEWHVDIIVMSFGLDAGWNHEISCAIKHAAQNSVIMFAAAANHGRNAPRSFPATERDVICVHACDGNGSDAGINPPPVEGDLNFSTLGVSVNLIWDSEEIFKSGTSFATPIAAGFAADALEIITRQNILPDRFHRRLFSGDGVRHLFEKMSVGQDGKYRYLAPWLLWKDSGYARATIRAHFGVPESEP